MEKKKETKYQRVVSHICECGEAKFGLTYTISIDGETQKAVPMASGYHCLSCKEPVTNKSLKRTLDWLNR